MRLAGGGIDRQEEFCCHSRSYTAPPFLKLEELGDWAQYNIKVAVVGERERAGKPSMTAIQGLVHRLVRHALSALREREHEVEQVIDVLRPGPLGILQHKFSRGELANAEQVAARARSKWQESEEAAAKKRL